MGQIAPRARRSPRRRLRRTAPARATLRRPDDLEVAVIRVLVADDHRMLRMAIVDLLNAAGDIVVVAECPDGDQVVEAALRTHPDVVLVDLAMPRKPGLEAARELLSVEPDARVVVLTGTPSASSIAEARRLGVCGYLTKDDPPEELPERLRDVAQGGTAWSSALLTV